MDLNNEDTTVDLYGRVAYQLRLCFTAEKTGAKTIRSPNTMFEQIKKLIQKSGKEIRHSVGRLGDLLVGSRQMPYASFFFTCGWYMRKAVEIQEKEFGKCTIQYDSEEVSKEAIAQYLGNYLKREIKKLEEVSDELLKGQLPEDLFGDDEPAEQE